jgi:hypothetical protein
MNKKFINHQSRPLKKGDTVKLLDILLGLSLGLTEIEKELLSAEIGNTNFIQCSDRHGKIKLEFYDANFVLHTILINSSCSLRL